jgi:hypothetical protein
MRIKMKKLNRKQLRKMISEASMYGMYSGEKRGQIEMIYSVIENFKSIMENPRPTQRTLSAIDYEVAVDKSPLYNIIQYLRGDYIELNNDLGYFIRTTAQLKDFVNNHPDARDPLYQDNLERLNTKLDFILQSGSKFLGY